MSYGPRPWVQRHWDLRAAANFMLGGAGAGLVVASAIALPAPRLAITLALALVAAGLGAVWLETGRKLRALHVFFNPKTSWMTREALAALVLFVLGIAALVDTQPWLLAAAALAALAFVYCQARILRAAKGVPAWRAPEIVPLIGTSALAEGFALALFFQTVPLAMALFGLALVARAIASLRLHSALKRERCADALANAGRMLALLGTVAPLLLISLAHLVPQTAPFAALAALGAGWWYKTALITRAAFNQGFALPHVPVRGARHGEMP